MSTAATLNFRKNIFHEFRKFPNFFPLKISCYMVFQGDSLSPLLFAIILIPLSTLLKNTNMGYKLASGTTINLYMDDLKIYGKNHSEIESLLHSVEIFNLQMCFGISKCVYLGLKRGKIYSVQDINLLDSESIQSLASWAAYKYLGILDADVFQQCDMRSKITHEYLRRVRLILKSELMSRICSLVLMSMLSQWFVALLI